MSFGVLLPLLQVLHHFQCLCGHRKIYEDGFVLFFCLVFKSVPKIVGLEKRIPSQSLVVLALKKMLILLTELSDPPCSALPSCKLF